MRLQAVVFVCCIVALLFALTSRATSKHEPRTHARYQSCTARKAVSFYTGRIRYWSDKLGTAVPVSRALQVVSSSDRPGRCPRYVAHVLQRKSYSTRALYAELSASPRAAIRFVFEEYANQALAVSWCESRYDTGAQNGQYLGLFQMGSHERATFGHGSTAIAQAWAAWRYFEYSGRDWSPWSCQP
jgi:hypothetical protein